VPATDAWHVSRTLRMMELLAISPRSAPELADGLGVHVRTARRVLKRLEADGYVTLTEGRRRRYRPTMRVVALAGLVVAGAQLTQTARPSVTALRQQLGESCHLRTEPQVDPLPYTRGRRERAHLGPMSTRSCRATAPRPARRCSRGARRGARKC
jgi:DNA-binding Lrp family transcriptional regulator